MNREGYVYILANKRNGTLYIGVTGGLVRRVYEHRNDLIEGFSKKYSLHNLVYYERHDSIACGLIREKQLKKWNRKWKLGIIGEFNPDWRDLYGRICQ